MRIGDVTKNSCQIEMIKKFVSTILVDLSLEVNKDSGLKGGLAVENLGTS